MIRKESCSSVVYVTSCAGPCACRRPAADRRPADPLRAATRGRRPDPSSRPCSAARRTARAGSAAAGCRSPGRRRRGGPGRRPSRGSAGRCAPGSVRAYCEPDPGAVADAHHARSSWRRVPRGSLSRSADGVLASRRTSAARRSAARTRRISCGTNGSSAPSALDLRALQRLGEARPALIEHDEAVAAQRRLQADWAKLDRGADGALPGAAGQRDQQAGALGVVRLRGDRELQRARRRARCDRAGRVSAPQSNPASPAARCAASAPRRRPDGERDQGRAQRGGSAPQAVRDARAPVCPPGACMRATDTTRPPYRLAARGAPLAAGVRPGRNCCIRAAGGYPDGAMTDDEPLELGRPRSRRSASRWPRRGAAWRTSRPSSP